MAGPVLRAEQLLPQIRADRPAHGREILVGVELCLIGLFQKVVVADNLALLVDACFARPSAYAGAALLVAAFAFVGQIYCDFAGYSTMARGLASLLGYALPENFAYPLLASDPVEHRRRWHITMGHWFRDYVYRPLGGDRGGTARTVFNTLVTWSLFGLWHGASWTFLFWGLYQGTILAAYRLAKGGACCRGERLAQRHRLRGHAVDPVRVRRLLPLAEPCPRRTRSSDASRTSRPARGSRGCGRCSWPPCMSCTGRSTCATGKASWRAPQWPGRLAVVGATLARCRAVRGVGDPFYYFQF